MAVNAMLGVPVGAQITRAGVQSIKDRIRQQMTSGSGPFETRDKVGSNDVIVLAAGLYWLWNPDKGTVKRIPKGEADLAAMAFGPPAAGVPITLTDSYATALRLAEDQRACPRKVDCGA